MITAKQCRINAQECRALAGAPMLPVERAKSLIALEHRWTELARELDLDEVEKVIDKEIASLAGAA